MAGWLWGLAWVLSNGGLGLLLGSWTVSFGGFFALAFVSPICGVVQAVILLGMVRPKRLPWQFPWAMEWGLLTALGGLSAQVLAVVVMTVMFTQGSGTAIAVHVCVGCLAGAVIGFFQWMPLREVAERAWWWIGASALSGIVAGPAVYAATFPFRVFPFEGGSSQAVVAAGIAGLLHGLLTALVLASSPGTTATDAIVELRPAEQP